MHKSLQRLTKQVRTFQSFNRLPSTASILRCLSNNKTDEIANFDGSMPDTTDPNFKTPLLSPDLAAPEKHYSRSRTMASSNMLADTFPVPSFTYARQADKRKLPQSIAHRGYKTKYPENTMAAFRGAIEEGRAHAIETDIHLTKDDVVVLSHDPNLKRCFGREEKIIDCDWSFLAQLKTTRAPHTTMPRLRDLLEYIAQPDLQEKWILLDIKLDNDADNVMRLIARTLSEVDPGSNIWKKRVVLGIWAAKYLPLCVHYLPEYPVAYIGFSTFYARQFLKVPNVGFNMFQKTLLGPIGARFIRDVQKADRALYLWTVNEVNMMKWSIQKGVDGVITDDPETFNEVCDNWTDTQKRVHPTWKQWAYTFWLYIIMALFSIPLRHRLPGSVNSFLKAERAKVKLAVPNDI